MQITYGKQSTCALVFEVVVRSVVVVEEGEGILSGVVRVRGKTNVIKVVDTLEVRAPIAVEG